MSGIGSAMNSAYRAQMNEAAAALPASLRHAARDSIGTAHAAAAPLPAGPAQHLDAIAAHAFTHAPGIGFLTAALSAIAAAPIVARYLPPSQSPKRTENPLPVAGTTPARV
jgi:hypothetical protein